MLSSSPPPSLQPCSPSFPPLSHSLKLVWEVRMRGSSHLAGQARRLSPKLLLRNKGRNPLKYIMSVVLSDFEYFIEKGFHLLTKVFFFILRGPKSTKKYCHVDTLEAFHLWSLATSVKAQRSSSRSPPIKLLDFLHLLTNRSSLKAL